jgi:hypothetical protein
LVAVTEFTSNILKLLKGSWQPDRDEIDDIKSVFDELCRGLNARDFSPATQERFVNVVAETWDAHTTSALTGTLSHNFMDISSQSLFVQSVQTNRRKYITGPSCRP